MNPQPSSAPPPDLRIVPIKAVLPHETSDSQRALPLIERLRLADVFTNPPVVGEVDGGKYVLMDGANRHLALQELGFDHILAQVAEYDSPYVALDVWQHALSNWSAQEFLARLQEMEAIRLSDRADDGAIATLILRGGARYSLRTTDAGRDKNAILREVVEIYHQAATLYRTPLKDAARIWQLYPDAFALMFFPAYQPSDIVAAALSQDPLPPGISRHIIHGRALKLNYPMSKLRDATPLDKKNQDLQAWMREKLATRSLRFYAESTWQFDE